MALKPLKTLNFGGEDTYYLKPEWKNIAETTVTGDTLTWDGNTEGLTVIDPMGDGSMLLVRVSDTTPTMADFSSGGKFITSDGESEFTADEVSQITDEILSGVEMTFVIVLSDNCEFEGIAFPEKGIYFMVIPSLMEVYSLTIYGYTGLLETKVIKVPDKYIPEWVSDEKTIIFYYNNNHIYKDAGHTEEVTKADIPINMHFVIEFGTEYRSPIALDMVNEYATIKFISQGLNVDTQVDGTTTHHTNMAQIGTIYTAEYTG